MSLQAYGSAERIEIYREGEPIPLVIQNATSEKRAFIHPILAPDGIGELTENEPTHHAWQHGLYIGLNDVNGIGFWTERLTGNPNDGTFHPFALSEPCVEDSTASWQVVSEWKGPLGQQVLTETQSWKISDLKSTLFLELLWTVEAGIDIRFGQSSYGGLFLRMPWRKETGGEILNSEGSSTHEGAEGKRARWMAVAMPIEGRENKAGVALLDHRSNPGHPIHWRVDNELGVGPSRSIAAEWNLAKGESTQNRYGVVVFSGEIDRAHIELAWNRFARE